MSRFDLLGEVWVLVFSVGLLGLTVSAPATAATSAHGPIVDADVRTQAAAGRARVIVELHVPGRGAGASAGAIVQAQDAVLARVPAVLVRRFHSVPLLALEIDAAGLRALEALGGLVARVQLDHPVRPQ